MKATVEIDEILLSLGATDRPEQTGQRAALTRSILL